MKRPIEQPQETELRRKRGSLAFFFAIPGSFGMGSLFLLSFLELSRTHHLQLESWVLFSSGFFLSFILLRSTTIMNLRAVIHELKHAALIVMTGNKVNELSVASGNGRISYEIFQNKTRFQPFIILAPYFFPLFSFPLLFIGIVGEIFLGVSKYIFIVYLLLGLALAADLVTGFQELHPGQSDLKRILGGDIAVSIFLLGVNFFWIMACLLWVLAGHIGYVYASHTFLDFAEALARAVGGASP